MQLVPESNIVRIILRNDTELYVPLKLKDALYQAIQEKPFIEVQGVLINKHQIVRVEPAYVDQRIMGLTDEQREYVKQRIKEHKARLGKNPSKGTISNYIKKSKDGR